MSLLITKFHMVPGDQAEVEFDQKAWKGLKRGGEKTRIVSTISQTEEGGIGTGE